MSYVEAFPATYKPAEGSLLIGGEPHVIHCHYYNHFLQTSIEDAQAFYDARQMMVDTAQEVAHNLFRNLFREVGAIQPADRFAWVERTFSECGYGKVSLGHLSIEGGEVETPYEHYSYSYSATFPQRKPHEPGAAFFAGGYLSGALEAVYELPLGSIQMTQTACLSKGDSITRWRFERTSPRPLVPSPGYKVHQMGPILPGPNTQMPREAIRDAVLSLPLHGDPQTGLIEAFGVLLVKMPANYYALISFRHIKALMQKLGEGGYQLATDMLREAGHVCAFNTLGGIMQSAEWQAVVQPHIRTREDWIHGIFAVMLALGWGIPNILSLEPSQKLETETWNAYEDNTYLATYGSDSACSGAGFFYQGLLMGIMALLYHAEIDKKVLTLDGALYKELFGQGKKFQATQVACRIAGASSDRFLVRAR
ncbi:MAG: hypothetical protein ACUVRD_08905 [Bacteroidia bacterium]